MPLPILALAGLATSAAMASSIAALHAGRVVVPRIADWGDVNPLPVIDSAMSYDWQSRVGAAISETTRWLQLRTDLRWSSPYVALGDRPDGPRPGEVLISVGPRLARSVVASAAIEAEIEPGETEDPDDSHELWAVGATIERAQIVLDPLRCEGRDLVRILAHELVHTQGFEHCTARLGRKHAANRHLVVQFPKSGHLMHPLYDEGGWSLRGLPGTEVRGQRGDLWRRPPSG